MSFSLNEVHMTLRKALCGRSLAFGVADDFGAAGARLSSGSTADGIATVLALDNNALVQLLHSVETTLGTSGDKGLEGAVERALAEQLQGRPFPRDRACAISAESWQQALDLSHLTYVPESEESRLAGAGAGTNDND